MREVDNFDGIIAQHHDVVRFEISVKETTGMNVLKAIRNAATHPK